MNNTKSKICIVGGGPAGMLTGYLLARSGVEVTVLEKHADFLRDFRGDTVHPSTLEVLQTCGLLDKFNCIAHDKVQRLSVQLGDDTFSFVDFEGLKPFDYLAFVPQWDFLNLLASEASKLPSFTLRMEHKVTELIRNEERVIGVKGENPNDDFYINSDLVIACDGRQSTVRQASNLQVNDLGAPMDAMWFKIARLHSKAKETMGIVGAGNMLVLLNRNDYWQAAYIVPKGSDATIRQQPIASFHDSIVELAPFLQDSIKSLISWAEVKTLVVKVDRLKQWCSPGVLLIGDAAHAMSPIGGVGINLALQDAVAAANILSKAIHQNIPLELKLLKKVQKQRQLPTKIIQALQTTVQNRIISNVLTAKKAPSPPAFTRWLFSYRWVRNIPARLIGYGFRRERVDTTYFK